jgi:hypothetical protein
VLVAVAEGSHASSGVSTVGGDRVAMLVASLIGFSAAIVAWFGSPSSTTPAASHVDVDVLVEAN